MSTSDALSQILRGVRFSGALQFCIAPSGPWRIDAGASMRKLGLVPGRFVPFHVIAKGSCWLVTGTRRDTLQAGDVVAFPFASQHELGSGEGGRLLDPATTLPPKPWASVPVLRSGDGGEEARILCGYVECAALTFGPFSACLPEVLMARSGDGRDTWLAATVLQIEREVEAGGAGSSSMLERLTETMFIQVLRQHIEVAAEAREGWLAACADPQVGRAIAGIHKDPQRDWTLEALAQVSGASRSVLVERFQRHLGVSPMRYVRDWRLHRASLSLAETNASVAEIAAEAGYASEAAFTRAFARTYGAPPAAWRKAR